MSIIFLSDSDTRELVVRCYGKHQGVRLMSPDTRKQTEILLGGYAVIALSPGTESEIRTRSSFMIGGDVSFGAHRFLSYAPRITLTICFSYGRYGPKTLRIISPSSVRPGQAEQPQMLSSPASSKDNVTSPPRPSSHSTTWLWMYSAGLPARPICSTR